MADFKDEFTRIRQNIEAADTALAAALEQRGKAMKQFIDLKARDPEGYYALPRETDTLARARETVHAFPPDAVEPVFREVFSASTAMVAPIEVAFLGPEGGFAHAAARQRFGAACVLRSVDDMKDIVDEITRERASFGILPLETSTDGAVTSTLHGLLDSDLKVTGEVTLTTSYHLLSKTGNATDIEKIFASPAGIAACDRYIGRHFPKATVLDVRSNSVAAELAKDDHGAAAIGTDILAQTQGLRYVRERIEDVSGVVTRFAVVGKQLPARTGTDRTMLGMAVHDAAGALYRALQPFADRQLNLTRLESRPVSGAAWPYVFFVELDGHVTDRSLVAAMDELRAAARFIKVLGSYPRPT